MTTCTARGLLAGLGCLLLCQCDGGARPERWNVILISLDTLRADRLGAYGSQRGLTPTLDALAGRARVATRAQTPANHTLAAHASLLTGLAPESHRLLAPERALPGERPTLAEWLLARGYRTAAFVNAGWLHPRFGFARGFEHYDFVADQALRAGGGDTAVQHGRHARETNQALLSWLDAQPGDRPLFVFLHYFDAHSDWGALPYDAAPETVARVAGDPPPEGFAQRAGLSASRYLVAANRRGWRASEQERHLMPLLYDAGVADLDAALGELLAALASRSLLERSLVLVTADHGEELQEHGQWLHAQVYREILDVPLLLQVPDALASRVPELPARASLIDVVPSLLGLLEIDAPPGLDGENLLAPGAAARLEARILLGRSLDEPQRSASDGRFKLVRSPGEAALYDLGRDPGERVDVARAHPESLARLSAAIDAADARALGTAGHATEPLDPAIAEGLRALGYTLDE